VFTAGDVRSGSVNSSRSPVSQAPTNAGSARAGLKLLPDAAVTESEAGGGAEPGLPLPMGQLAQPFPAYLAQLALGVTLPPLDPPSLNPIALKSLWVGVQLLATHRRSRRLALIPPDVPERRGRTHQENWTRRRDEVRWTPCETNPPSPGRRPARGHRV
jgi:hypothetical protein